MSALRLTVKTGDFHVYSRKTIVDEVEDDRTGISLAEAEKNQPRL